MGNGLEEFRLTVQGESAIENAIDALERFEEKAEFNSVSIELRDVSSDTSPKETDTQITLREAGSQDDNQPSGVRPGTSHDKVLSALDQISNKEPVPTKSILEDVDSPEGTVYAAMSDLHDRGLVNRTDKRNVENSYGYTVSDAGKKEISRLEQVE